MQPAFGAKISYLIIRSKYANHIFSNVPGLKKILNILEKQLCDRDIHFLQTSRYLHEYLQTLAFNKNWIITLKKPVMYRRVPASRDPLSVSGAIACGGRLNIGGSQMSHEAKKHFGTLVTLQGAIYASCDADTARKEFGDDGMVKSTAITYKLQLKSRKQLKLISIDDSIDSISVTFPALKQIVSAGSLYGAYYDVKKIIPTQLFAHWLFANCPCGVDGFIFDSTVDPGHKNICLYFSDDSSCKKALKATAKV